MVNNIKWLKGELGKWKKKKIITEAQEKKIKKYYEKDGGHESKVISVLAVLGAILVGAGVILFVASNWRLMPKTLKLILLFGTTFATYLAGWHLEMNKKREILGKSLMFLASLFVGATIFLTAQIFNVNADAHWLVLLWFIAVAPLSYTFFSKQILVLSLATFSLWFVMYMSDNNTYDHPAFRVFMMFLYYGIGLYGIGQLHELSKKFSDFRVSYQGTGLLFALVAYFYFSLETPYEQEFGSLLSADWTANSLLLVFAVAAVAAVFLAASGYKKYKTIPNEFWVMLMAFLGALGLSIFSLYADSFMYEHTQYGYSRMRLLESVETILFIIFNLLLFTISIGSILIGYHKRKNTFVNIGMIFFIFGTLHLYFTTLYEFLPRSLAFVVGGLILLGGGYYLERKRRTLTTSNDRPKVTFKSFLLAISLPAAIILIFLAIKLSTIFSGSDIVLKVNPVDPRDPFRGDYVVLRYDISELDADLFPYFVDEKMSGHGNFYAVLEEKEGIWDVSKVERYYYDDSFVAPKLGEGQRCMRGEIVDAAPDTYEVKWGIESFFVPEGEGKDIEDARNDDRVTAIVTVDPNCNAILKNLAIDGKPLE